MSTGAPLVSVLTATYNGEAFVVEAIESVLAQTYRPIEHVLVDDASGDGTRRVLQRYAERHPDRVRVVFRAERAGPCSRRNDALAESRGEVLAWLDQDDVWLPEKIERQVEALLADPNVGLVYSQYEEFDHETGATLDRSHETAEGDLLAELFVRGCFVASSTAVWRRELMDRRDVGFRQRHFSFGDDYFLWLAISLDARTALVDEALVRLRRHSANESARLARHNYHLGYIAVLEDHLRRFPETEARLGRAKHRGLAAHYRRAAEFELDRRRPVRAAAYWTRALRLDPAETAGTILFRRRMAAARLKKRLRARVVRRNASP